MSEKPSAYASCEIEMAFGDGDYVFRLPLKQLGELQEKCGAGLGTIYRRLMTGEYYAEDIHETVRLGLIGGGMDATKARVLMERYFDDIPVMDRLDVAKVVIAACVVGYEPAGDKKKDGAEMTEADGSTSPAPSETEPSPDSAPKKPSPLPTGNTARSSTSGASETKTPTKRPRRSTRTSSKA